MEAAISGSFALIIAPLGITALLGFALIFLIWKSGRSYDCWKKRGVPYVKPYPFFGSVLENLGRRIHEVENDRYKKYGAVYGHFEGTSPFLSVADPELVRSVLVKDFHIFSNRRELTTGDVITESMLQLLQGENWKRVRTIVSPTFSTGKIKRMMSIFSSCSKVLVDNYSKFAEKGEPVDVKKIFGAFSMDVIANSAFSTKIDSHNDPNNAFVTAARPFFQNTVPWRLALWLVFPSIVKLFSIKVASPLSTKFFADVTLNIIKERKRTGQTRNDFLQLLIEAADEQKAEEKVAEKGDNILNNYEGETNEEVFKNFKPKKTLSSDELVAQCVIFFLAGFETTASALSFACYYLALNPAIQDKLFKELDETIRAENGELTYESLQGMKYLDNVISETLRINPPAIRLERVASTDYKLGNTGITVPKKTCITIPVYAIHRDPKFYPEPLKFDPDRFLPEERAKRNPYTFMPFGSGPRNCVAMRFALVEVKVCLVYVLSHFRIKACPQTKVPLEYRKGSGLLQPLDVTLLMEMRENIPLKN